MEGVRRVNFGGENGVIGVESVFATLLVSVESAWSLKQSSGVVKS